MQLRVNFDTQRLNDALHNLAREARVAPGVVMKQEAKQIVEAVMKLTPPATYAQGRAAVARDLGKVFTTLPAIQSKIKNLSFQGKAQFQAALTRAAKSGDEEAVRNMLTQQIQGAVSVNVKPHQRNGVAVPGYTQTRRVTGPVLPGITGSTQVGGSLNPNLHTARRNNRGKVAGGDVAQITMQLKELNDYRKAVLSRVSWAMAGWLLLARQVSAKVPQWVNKTRLETVSGTATTNFAAKPFVRAVNLDVKIPGYQRVINTVIATRIRVAGKKIEALIKGRAVNLGFMRVSAR